MSNQTQNFAEPSKGEPYPFKLSQPVICIVGPTASGKTALAQELALHLDGEVVSADSMQVYRGMDIGTGKLPKAEQKVPHHGIDLCAPDENYSVALYQSYARTCFKEIEARNKQNILCGGTGLYVRAAIDDYDFPKGEQRDNPVRDFYTQQAEELGSQALWELLNTKDPESAALIHPHNVRRVVRAFEMLEEETSYAEQHQNYQNLKQLVPAYCIGLNLTPSILNERIDIRVDTMIEKGLVEEVEGLLRQGFRTSITAPQAIGYKEIVAAFDGKITLNEAIQQIKTATHRYAKRQRTWFRADKRIHWIDADNEDTEQLADQARNYLGSLEA